MERIQQLLDSFVEKGMAVGTSVLIFKDGKEAFYGSAGCMYKGGEPFRRDAIMAMYSMTKPVIGAACAKLFEQKLAAPETPIHEFLPAFRHMSVLREDGTLEAAREPLTIEHLLTMTGGICTPREGMEVMPYFQKALEAQAQRGPASTIDVANLYVEMPLLFQPGEKWMYGMGPDVLGGVIAAATGMELQTYLEKEFYQPLGIHDMCFHVLEEKHSRMAGLYNVEENDEFVLRPKHTVLYGNVDITNADRGSGGMFGTLDDYIRFGEMLRKGGDGILAPETVAEMTRNHLNDAQIATFNGQPTGYGYGWLVRTMMHPEMRPFGTESTGCFGWDGMAGTTLRIDPARGLTTVFGIQRIPAKSDCFIPPLLDAIKQVWPVEG